MLTLFFVLIIAIVVFQVATQKSLGKVYPQLEKKQIKRLVDPPFYFASWTLMFALIAFSLSALTSMMGELFNVDNYIGLFGGGWLGLLLRFLRSNGFIGDIQEPMVLQHYRDVINLVCNVSVIMFLGCIGALYDYCNELKKPKINGTHLLSSYYISMAVAIASFISIMWAIYMFEDMMDHAIDLKINEIYMYFTLAFILTTIVTMFFCNKVQKTILLLPQCETSTWQQVFAKFKIKTEKGQQPIQEKHIVYISVVFALLISAYVILRTLPINEEYIPEEVEQSYEEETAVSSVEDEVLNEDDVCMGILRKYYTASNAQIQEWGGQEAFETSRFITYTKHLDFVPLTNTQDFDIGDDCLRVENIKPYAKWDHSYIITISCGYSDGIPVCVVMKEDNGTWKIDNISLEPYTMLFIDYSRPASDYECGEGEPDVDADENIIIEETKDEDFIAL